MSLAILNPHPRDSRISFQEEGHLYRIEGLDGHPISVTTLIHQFFEPFDADTVIAKMMKSRNWPNSKYFGKTAEEIKAGWDQERDSAASLGTAMHKSIEDFMNLPDVIREEYRLYFQIHEKPHPTLPSTPEFVMFNRFWNDILTHNSVKPYRSEWLVFDEDKRLSGSIDMTLTDPDGNILILDWKRSKELKKSNVFQRGRPPVTHLEDCNYNHYSLQLNIYRHLLETRYGKRVIFMYLVILHPNQEEYQLVEVKRMEKEIEEIFKLLPLERQAH